MPQSRRTAAAGARAPLLDLRPVVRNRPALAYVLANMGHSFENYGARAWTVARSEEHTSELQSLMRISYAVFCLKKNKKNTLITTNKNRTTPKSRNTSAHNKKPQIDTN